MQHFSAEDGRIGNHPVARVLSIIAIACAAVLIVWVLSSIIMLIFLAVLIAVILRGIADWASRKTRVGERAMLAVVSILCALLLLGFLYELAPKLIGQLQEVWSTSQERLKFLRDRYGNTGWGHMLLQQFSPSQALQGNIGSYAGTIATSTIGSLATALVLIVTALYFAIAPMLYVEGVVRLFPIRHRARARHLMLHIGDTLRWWSLGQLIDMVAVGILSWIGLWLLGIPLALALGALAGLFTFVPYFGAIAAAVPAMLVGLNVSWQTSLWVLLIFLICHGIEGYIIAPVVQRRTVELPPALTILSMTVLGAIFGPLGVVLGTPAAAVMLLVVREAYVGEVLGDPEIEGPREP